MAGDGAPFAMCIWITQGANGWNMDITALKSKLKFERSLSVSVERTNELTD